MPSPSWIHNPVTGEVARVNVADEQRLSVDLWLQPGAAVLGAHVHDRLIERYEVLAGEVAFQLVGAERVVRPGDGRVEIPAGTVHDWWNAGTGTAHVAVEIEGSAAARFLRAIETLWSLAALGRTDAAGMPDRLWQAAIGQEFRDVVRFTEPPAAVQATLGPLAAAIARRTGRDPLAPRLHGPAAPCALADPGEAGLEALLAEPVGARAARRR